MSYYRVSRDELNKLDINIKFENNIENGYIPLERLNQLLIHSSGLQRHSSLMKWFNLHGLEL